MAAMGPSGQRNSVSESEFVVRPFVQAPDAEIKIAGRFPQASRWVDRWGRRCGNPATSVIAKIAL